jgi:hypothetical protein
LLSGASLAPFFHNCFIFQSSRPPPLMHLNPSS